MEKIYEKLDSVIPQFRGSQIRTTYRFNGRFQNPLTGEECDEVIVEGVLNKELEFDYQTVVVLTTQLRALCEAVEEQI